FAPAGGGSCSRAPARPSFEALEDRIAPATHVWRGGIDPFALPEVNTRWSVAANWASGGSPAGDPNAVLVFPTNAVRFASVNDLGRVPIREIDLQGSGYTISGFLGTGGILLGDGGIRASNASGSNTISSPITLDTTDRVVS